MQRATFLEQVAQTDELWDVAVIGGGATGLGIAVDAAARGFSVVLLEQQDFGKGTSSRSTKLIHGGVRYLQQGNISLVREALEERELLYRNAPHLVHRVPFVVPNYRWWEAPFYGLGLKTYDLLAGKHSFGCSALLSRDEVLARIPTLRQEGLRGGVLYHDGQFDDSRLLINLAQTAAEHGACVLNYARVLRLVKHRGGQVSGLSFRDEETGQEHTVKSRCVINATGPFCEELRRLDNPATEPLIATSQGVHLVLDNSFLPGNTALMVPHTPDGRVMFAIPWHHRVVVGTTDTPIKTVTLEPKPLAGEIEFILNTAGAYLVRGPTHGDIGAVFTGIRPLLAGPHESRTASLSREHSITISDSGLLTITGGKWTTYRKMAEDCVNDAILLAGLPARPCVTETLRIHGAAAPDASAPLGDYGSDAPAIHELMRSDPALAKALHPALPTVGAQIVWAARHEMARTVEDALARRTRALFLNVRAAIEMAPAAARLLARELGRDEAWEQRQLEEFKRTAEAFR